jgi:AcrR family transcriptional regulator
MIRVAQNIKHEDLDMAAKRPVFSIVEVLASRLRDTSYRKGEKTKFALMKAAAELLGDQPLSEIRNIDICVKADVSAGLLNTYFNDKHDLIAQLLALFVEYLQAEYEPHREDLPDETDAYVRIYNRIKYMIDVSQRNLGVFRLLMLESPDFPNPQIPHLRETTDRFWVNDLAETIPNEKAGLKLMKKDRFTIAALLGAMVDEAIRHILLKRKNGETYRTKKLVEMLAILRFSAIYGADPTPESRQKAR